MSLSSDGLTGSWTAATGFSGWRTRAHVRSSEDTKRTVVREGVVAAVAVAAAAAER